MESPKSPKSPKSKKHIPCGFKDKGCIQMFTKKSNMRTHMTNSCHFREKTPQKCAICRGTFKNARTLQKHLTRLGWFMVIIR